MNSKFYVLTSGKINETRESFQLTFIGAQHQEKQHGQWTGIISVSAHPAVRSLGQRNIHMRVRTVSRTPVNIYHLPLIPPLV